MRLISALHHANVFPSVLLVAKFIVPLEANCIR